MVNLLRNFREYMWSIGQTDTPIHKKDRNLNLSPLDIKVFILNLPFIWDELIKGWTTASSGWEWSFG